MRSVQFHRPVNRVRRAVLESLEPRTCLSATADFNGDGYADLAVGVNGEDGTAGGVSVIFGTAGGLSAGTKFSTPDQFFKQGDGVLTEIAQPGDQLGRTLAAGDFDHDGFSDLAIGVPFEDGTVTDIGVVHILRGSPAGLTNLGVQVPMWHQNLLGFHDEAEDFFGAALAVGDFNGDHFDDLAVGAPGETYGGELDTGFASFNNIHNGVTFLILGSQTGLTAQGCQFLTPQIDGVLRPEARYCASLAAGDFDKDGFDDLAMGAPGFRAAAFKSNSGGVAIYHGEFDGLRFQTSFTQNSPGIVGDPEDDDRFGFSLAVGDFNNNGADDLAIGVPNESIGDLADAGVVHVLYGQPGSGLTDAGSQTWSQDSLSGATEAGDLFGFSLATGDFNGDGRDDLAAGAPLEDVGSISNAGAVNVLFGSSTKLTATGNLFLTQDTAGIADVAEANDRFGFAVGAFDFNNDTRADLAVGAIGENNNAGVVHAIFGAASGLTATANQLWSQDTIGIEDVSEAGDFFGVAFPGTSGVGSAGFSGKWVSVRQVPSPLPGLFNVRGRITVTNPGTEYAGPSVIHFFLSDDNRLSKNDKLIKDFRIGPLIPLGSRRVDFVAKLAKGVTARGKYLIAVLDATNVVRELDESNNILAIGPIP